MHERRARRAAHIDVKDQCTDCIDRSQDCVHIGVGCRTLITSAAMEQPMHSTSTDA